MLNFNKYVYTSIRQTIIKLEQNRTPAALLYVAAYRPRFAFTNRPFVLPMYGF